MALIDITNLGRDQSFRDRVQAAILVTAVAIETEGAGVAGHAQRLAVAAAVLQNPTLYAGYAAVAIATNSSIQALYLTNRLSSDVTEAALTAAAALTSPLWNILAGV